METFLEDQPSNTGGSLGLDFLLHETREQSAVHTSYPCIPVTMAKGGLEVRLCPTPRRT